MASGASTQPVPEQLPRGRHGLSREQVASSQRERMLLAMADAVSERGYSRTPVAEVLRRAGVSRETFYEQFENKEDCFVAAYDAAAGMVLAATARAPGGRMEAVGRVEAIDGALERYLTTLAQEPAFARTFMVEVYAAGAGALARRVEIQDRFVAAVADMVGAREPHQRFACEMLVAAIIALVTQRICAGQTETLPDLHAPLMRQIESVLATSGLSPEPER